MDNTITLYKWILDELTVSARARSVQKIAPYLSSLIHPGNEVLDLCSGTGPTSFWFEEQGVKVTGIDFAPYMIAAAREEAFRRGSSAEFLEADITRHDFGTGRYDLIGVFGNSITDFPLSDFAALGKKAAAALKPNGKFVVQYQDASYRFFQGSTVRGGGPRRACCCKRECSAHSGHGIDPATLPGWLSSSAQCPSRPRSGSKRSSVFFVQAPLANSSAPRQPAALPAIMTTRITNGVII